VSPDPDRFAAFSRDLDTEVARQRIRRALDTTPPLPAEDPAELSRLVEAGDPLAEAGSRRWTVAIREVFSVWPGRVAVAAALGAVLVVGLLVGRVVTLTSPPTIVAEAPPLPAYRPESGPGVGFAPSIRPESEQKFREAMAQYGQPDFARRALPLLREAVAADPRNDQAQFWLGVVLLREGRSTDAIAPLETASRLARADRTYKGYLLYAYLQAGTIDRARALQQELLKAR